MVKPDARGLLLSYLKALGSETDTHFLRETLRVTLQLLMEMEVSSTIEASPYERNDERRAYRNGYRERVWRSTLGEIPLRIPKLRKGTYYPSFIDSLEEAEDALLALVQDAYLQGVSPHTVQETFNRLGLAPADRSQIADLCERLDDMVYEFRERPLTHAYPYLWIDVMNLPGRARHYDVAVAVGVQENGNREILGFEVAPYAEGRDFWQEFLDHLVERGLQGVQVITSDSYEGLKPALRQVLPYTEWQPRREPAATSEAIVAAVSPVVWVDSSVPDGNTIISGLSNVWTNMPVLYGYTEVMDEVDEMALTRLAGGMLMVLQTAWHEQVMMVS
jgi:transposase-like protein